MTTGPEDPARRPDLALLSAGGALVALGGVLALDAAGAVDLGLGALAPLVLAVVGVILLGSGLGRRA